MAAGSAGLSGTVMAPSAYRGRIVALSNNLRILRAITGFTHPDLRLNGVAVGPFIGNAGNLPVIKGDPGPFADNDPTSGPVVPFVEDVPELTDVGASVSLVNGWMYVTYRNGHTRAYSNVGGGAAGAGSGNPPLFQPPASNTGGSGTVVWGPEPAPANPGDKLDPAATPAASEGGIHLLAGRRLEDVRTITGGKITVTGARLSTSSFNPTDLDKTLMVEYGQTLFFLVDFGRASRLLAPQSLDFNKATNGMTPAERLQHWQGIDGQVLQGEIRGQVIGGPGAVQGLGNSAQGVRPQLISVGDTEDHIGAIVPIFCGLPSGNPLTPGTPMLWERDPNDTNWNFDGQIVYHVQITQQGVQWRWRDRTTDPTPAPNKVHYWDQERPDQGVRFKTTGGLNGTNARWNWRSEWAPLISYNNPLALQYDPDGPDQGVFEGLPGVPSGTITLVDLFTDRLDTRRKNGDPYLGSHRTAANGSRAGSGNPEVPVVGMGIAGGQSRQLLYGDHGRTTPVATDVLPGLGSIGVADRSFLGAIGQTLKIRVQRVPLTKMGSGAALGSVGDPALAGSVGSFQQNANYLDDGPHGMYSSISENRLLVTKAGTAVDVSASPIPIRGRDANYQLPTVVGPLNANVMDRLGVQIDVPNFTADDLYSTRWRYAAPQGALPTRALNPLFPGAGGLQMWDRAEAFARAPFPAADDTAQRLRNTAHLEERPHPDVTVPPQAVTVTLDGFPVGPRDDRLRRVAIFVDANGNGQLDLAPNLREAYRTFAVQVMVKPEMKLEAQQQALDLGAVWHGKKQPGLGRGNAAEAWEWQAMQQMLASGNPVQVNLANFYRQYWRPFTLRNTGNVNLAFVKPEVAYQIPGQPVEYIGLPSPGNDPFRALTLISPLGGAALRDPLQIFLRTSFDDMLLPDQSAAYGAGTRGVWLQKSVVGAGQPSSVLYAARTPVDVPNARDPSVPNGGLPRESYLTLNLPTGTAMGQYRGSLRFFNDRGVTLVETPALAPGYRYVRPETLAGVSGTAGFNGTLDRDPRAISLGEPLEPATDPPVRLVTKVTENVVHGRFARADNDLSATTNAERDRRNTPAVAPNLLQSNPSAPQGTVRELMVAYVSNRPTTTTPAVPRPTLFDLYGTRLVFDTTRSLFPYDEIPQFRDPWRPLTTTSTPFWTQFSDVAQFSAGGQNVTELEKPCIVQDVRTPFRSFVAWTTRRSVSNQGSGTAAVEQSVINYQRLTPTPGPLQQILPGGQLPDLNVIRSGVRFLPIAVNAPPIGPTPDPWFAFYSTGQGTRRTLAFTTNGDPSLADNQWAPERVLPTSRSLSTVGDPFPIVSEPIARQPGPLPNRLGQSTLVQGENAALPQLTWVAYSGQNDRFGQRDVYLSRHRVVNGLLTAGGLMGTNQITQTNDYGRMAFPRVTSDVLKANAARTVFTSGGADFQLNAYSLVTLYLGRGDIAPGAPALVAGRNGSLVFPISLLPQGTLLQVVATNGEYQLPLEPAVVALGATPQIRAELQRVRVMLDIQAGTFRLSMNTRTLARLLLGNPRGLAAGDMPDPVLSADYTPTTLRLTRGDAAATRPVLVASWDPQGGSGSPVMDASWYRQWIDPFTDSSGRNKYQLGLPVAGQADRIWVLWNRATGNVSGGPTLYYKVMRPGIRVRAGSIHGVRPAELQVTVGGAAVVPEEVNPQTGQIFLTRAQEGQPVAVRYLVPSAGGGFTTIVETDHFVTWQDESGEKPVPLELSVNESGVDAFASYEDVQLTRLNGGAAPVAARHLERVWLFWSSSRGASGDLFYGSLAPRIGPDVNVNGSVTLFSTAAPGSRSPNAARAQAAGMAAEERRRPFTLPGISRPGPYVPVPGSTSPLRGLSSR